MKKARTVKNGTQATILQALQEGRRTTGELCELTGLQSKQVMNALQNAKANGKVVRYEDRRWGLFVAGASPPREEDEPPEPLVTEVAATKPNGHAPAMRRRRASPHPVTTSSFGEDFVAQLRARRAVFAAKIEEIDFLIEAAGGR